MTKELERDYEKFSELVSSGLGEAAGEEALFRHIVQTEVDAFCSEYGCSCTIRTQVLAAMFEVMAVGMRQQLERTKPGLSDNVDILKEMLGVISFAI